ncbi:MAG: hypothetical protein ACLS36_01345 [Streptococcus sp.]
MVLKSGTGPESGVGVGRSNSILPKNYLTGSVMSSSEKLTTNLIRQKSVLMGQQLNGTQTTVTSFYKVDYHQKLKLERFGFLSSIVTFMSLFLMVIYY